MSEVIEFWSSGPMICCPLTLSRFPPEEFFSACCNHNSFGFVFWNICFSYVVFLAWILGLVALSHKVRQSILVQALSFRQDHSSLNNSLAKDVTSIAWKRLVLTIHPASWDIDMDKTKVFGTLFITFLKIRCENIPGYFCFYSKAQWHWRRESQLVKISFTSFTSFHLYIRQINSYGNVKKHRKNCECCPGR